MLYLSNFIMTRKAVVGSIKGQKIAEGRSQRADWLWWSVLQPILATDRPG